MRPLLVQVDGGLCDEVVLLKVPDLSGNRLVFACTGPVNRDYDDVRRFSDAAANGIKRSVDGPDFMFFSLSLTFFFCSLLQLNFLFPLTALSIHRALKAGMQRPLLVCPPHKDYVNSGMVAALGALHALYMVRGTLKWRTQSLRRHF